MKPGGTERLVVELAERSDLPTAICCLDELGAWGEELQARGVEVDCLNRQPGFHPALGYAIAKITERFGATVVHAHQYSSFVYSALARAWRPRLKVLFTEHGRLSDHPPSKKRRIANAVLSHVPHGVFAVSNELKRHICAEGFPEKKVGVVYNGITIAEAGTSADRASIRRQFSLDDQSLVIGTVARLDPVKDLSVLVRAVASLNVTRPAVLLVIGDGDERQHLEQVAREADGGESTRFLGHRNDARQILRACDIFANSSISEGVSLTILEAMAAALPVVATRVGGTPEVVDDTCACLVPARDERAMTAALAELAADPARRATMGRAGRTLVEQRFALDRMVRDYRDAYVRAANA